VTVTLYYDRKDDFYPDIVALLNEYRAVNPKISFTTRWITFAMPVKRKN